MKESETFLYEIKLKRITSLIDDYNNNIVENIDSYFMLSLLKELTKKEMDILFLDKHLSLSIFSFIAINSSDDSMYLGKISVFFESFFSTLYAYGKENKIQINPAVMLENINIKSIIKLSEYSNKYGMKNYVDKTAHIVDEEIAEDFHSYHIKDYLVPNLKELKNHYGYEFLNCDIVDYIMFEKINNF